MEFQEMDLSAVTFMLAEAILRKMGTEVTHHSVTRNFRDHTGSGDRKAEAIAIDDSGLRKRKGNHGQAINQDVVRRVGEGGNGGAHRFVRSAQDIDPVDFHGIDNAHRPAEVRIRDEIVINFFA
jgi:hypothetical protein